MLAHLPDATLVLDVIHAAEHLWEAANALLGERHPDRTAWVRDRLERLLTGRAAAVAAELERLGADPARAAAPRAVLRRAGAYYRRNLPYLDYPAYLARGWPIGTGVVEGACGHLVRDRLEQAGMRWTPAGAQAVLDLRAARLNGDWDAYWQFHREQQHQRLYGMAGPPAAPVEAQLAALAA